MLPVLREVEAKMLTYEHAKPCAMRDNGDAVEAFT
jgi:hypothetical protein